MVYLDYSATTYASEEVIKEFVRASKFGANPNSTHKVGRLASDMIDSSIKKMEELLNLNNHEIIITSGASESNNTVLKGVVEKYNIKKVITTRLEHSSIIAPLSVLAKKGVKVEFCELKDGLVDLSSLESMLEPNTLVSICAVDSELGIRQPIEEIGEFLKDKTDVLFHSDITQAIGKCEIDLSNVDYASCSAHKIYGFKGIGALIKKREVSLEPLIHGGKSITAFRSGTPQTELIVSFCKALELIIPNIKDNYEYVSNLNKKIVDFLNSKNILVNSINNIPHILNFSIVGKPSEEIKAYFSDNDIYISSKSACSSNSTMSSSVYLITEDEEKAKSSIRVSLSYKTTIEEVDYFLSVLNQLLEEE